MNKVIPPPPHKLISRIRQVHTTLIYGRHWKGAEIYTQDTTSLLCAHCHHSRNQILVSDGAELLVKTTLRAVLVGGNNLGDQHDGVRHGDCDIVDEHGQSIDGHLRIVALLGYGRIGVHVIGTGMEEDDIRKLS